MIKKGLENCIKRWCRWLKIRLETARGSDSAASAETYLCTWPELHSAAPLYIEGSRAGQPPKDSIANRLFSFFFPNYFAKEVSAPDLRRHISPLLLHAIQNTGEVNRRSIIQAIREGQNETKWGAILLALAAEIEITTIIEDAQMREFEKDFRIID